MSVGIIKKITEAEKTAEEIIKTAEMESVELIKKAEEDDIIRIKGSEKQQQIEGAQTIKIAELQAQTKAQEISQKNKELCKTLNEKANKNMGKAIDYIVKAIQGS